MPKASFCVKMHDPSNVSSNDWGAADYVVGHPTLVQIHPATVPTKSFNSHTANQRQHKYRQNGRPIRRVQEGRRGQPLPHQDPHQRRASRGEQLPNPSANDLSTADSIPNSTDLRSLQAGLWRRQVRRRSQARHVRPQGMTQFLFIENSSHRR